MANETEKKSTAKKPVPTADKPLSQKVLVDLLAKSEAREQKMQAQIDKGTDTMNQMVHRLQRVENDSGKMKSVNVESDRTFGEADVEKVLKFCKEPTVKDRFYLLPGFGGKIASGDPYRQIHGIKKPIPAIRITPKTTVKFVKEGAQVIQEFLRNRGDKRTEIRTFELSKIPTIANDQGKTGEKFFDIKRIISGMKESKHILLADGITSFEELQNNWLIGDKDFKRCVKTAIETKAAIKEIRAKAARGAIEQAEGMNPDQLQGGDFSE